MKIKPITAYAVVNKKKPKLDALEIYRSNNDLALDSNEKLIKVEIKVK